MAEFQVRLRRSNFVEGSGVRISLAAKVLDPYFDRERALINISAVIAYRIFDTCVNDWEGIVSIWIKIERALIGRPCQWSHLQVEGYFQPRNTQTELVSDTALSEKELARGFRT